MRFLEPGMAVWLLALPAALGFWLIHHRARRRFRRQAAIGPVLQGLSRLSTRRREAAVLSAALLAPASLVLAAMRPQIFMERRLPQYERQDLVLILDRSASMRARDVAPSRFGRAVGEIKAFLEEKPEGIDRVGLVGFAGTSLILSHLTRDLDSLFFFLDWIGEDGQLHFGTDIGAALASARELAAKDGRATRKVFLLLSDGDEQGRQLDRSLLALREERVRVHCIGIGSARETPIPGPPEEGAPPFLEDEQGRPLTTRFDENTLRRIAAETGGRYFRSTSGRELAAAMREVVKEERKLLGWKSNREYHDVHRLALMAGGLATAALLLIAL